MHPMDFFENAPQVKGGHCFVVMPFASELDTVYSAIKAALQGTELREQSLMSSRIGRTKRRRWLRYDGCGTQSCGG